MSVVELDHVTKRFGQVLALDDCSLAVEAGQTISLLGPSGCGKTTTLRLIAGFEEPDAGSVRINDRLMRGKRPYERNVGLLFQDYALFPHMTVEQNVGYGLRQRNFGHANIPARTAEMLKLVKLSNCETRRPSQLSGGQQQRVALARALATNPEVLLLDEPLSALDAKLRQELQVELKEILGKAGSTSIVVTHDQEEAMSLGDIILVMDQGKIVQRGTPVEIYSSPQSRFVAEFIGRSNWFAGKLRREPDGRASSMLTEDGDALNVPPMPVYSNRDYAVCVRPERIAVLDEAAGETPGEGDANILAATIVHSVPLGADIHVVATLRSGQRISVLEKNVGRAARPPGSAVSLRFDRESCIVIADG